VTLKGTVFVAFLQQRINETSGYAFWQRLLISAFFYSAFNGRRRRARSTKAGFNCCANLDAPVFPKHEAKYLSEKGVVQREYLLAKESKETLE
jgi:hypothetical protein